MAGWVAGWQCTAVHEHCCAWCTRNLSRHAFQLVLTFAGRPAPLSHLPQLVRRNEEARLLYEKVRLQQSALARGQAQYRDRLAEIRALKLKVGWGWRALLLDDWLRWNACC